MAVDKEKDSYRLHIHLSGNKYLVSNSLCMWIQEEKEVKNSKGEKVIRHTHLSGDHTSLDTLLDSYLRSTIRNTKLEGELEDLAKLVKKVKTEIKSWSKKMDKAMEE